MIGMVDPRRTRALSFLPEKDGPVVYWMSRDQRALDNWALLTAQERAFALQRPLIVVFCLAPDFLDAPLRHYAFLLEGLREVEAALSEKRIPFILLTGHPADEIVRFCAEIRAALVFTDFDPLNIKRSWKDKAAAHLECPLLETDAHNIVPCWEAAPQQEFAARTFRPKLHRQLPSFLTDFPSLQAHPFPWKGRSDRVDWQKAYGTVAADRSVKPLNWLKPGQGAGQRTLSRFISEKLGSYDEDRNDPNKNGQSDLSAYLHFGQISAQRVALEVGKTKDGSGKEAFLEELIVRRELSDNYCYYNRNYGNWNGFPEWAKRTLSAHCRDPRSLEQPLEKLESAESPDDLWNAAQTQMTVRGKMHGYLRMYWAKRMLEWSASPKEAQERCIYLHDKYSIDGRDPNGYTGIAWSIGGVHDRAWAERPIFGKVRFMSYKSTSSKIGGRHYIDKVERESKAELKG